MKIDPHIAPEWPVDAAPHPTRDMGPAAEGQTFPPARVALWRRALAFVLKASLPVVILLVALTIARDIMETAPDAGRRPPGRDARLVEVAPAELATRPPLIEAWGTVEPAVRAVARAEITGRVIAMHPELTPGGRIVAGAELVRVDDGDYRLALRQAETELDRIDAELTLERGNQAVARREYRLLGRKLSAEEEALVLRVPQLAQLEARREAALAAVEAARRNVARASVTAPFDAIVLSEAVDIGSVLGANSTEIATLVGADMFHVRLALPPGALRWIEIPPPGEKGARVHLHDDAAWGPDVSRIGHVVRLSAALTEQGRMTEVVVALEDPLGLGGRDLPQVLLGTFLRAEIDGLPVAGAVRIARSSLHDGDTVWIYTDEGTLDVRQVTVAWRDGEIALVTDGIAPGELVVTSPLATVAQGMALRTREPVAEGNGSETGASDEPGAAAAAQGAAQ